MRPRKRRDVARVEIVEAPHVREVEVPKRVQVEVDEILEDILKRKAKGGRACDW